MANNHDQFKEFNDTIKLDENKKSTLRTNRDALRSAITKYFREEKEKETSPKFSAQGSFMMHTIINPIPVIETDQDGIEKELLPYDLDDGVYFIDDIENRKSESTYHEWIYNAVKNHTTKGAIKKNTCVRVLYADGHNIDLPIYFREDEDDSIPELAHKTKKYTPSDPREFYKWFNAEANEQLKRIVRYMKAWRDKQNQSYKTKMPSGLILTILATNHYNSDERDDVAFRNTLQAIEDELNNDYKCERPTTEKGEDLLQKYSESHFKDRLSKLLDSANKAIEDKSQKESCKKWQRHLGDRFSCSNLDEDTSSKTKSYVKPAVINVNAGSA